VNQLYYAHSLAVLREHIKGETVDLVSLDPPFLGVENDGPEAFASLSRAAARVRRGGRGGGSPAGGRGGRERLVSVARRRGLETS